MNTLLYHNMAPLGKLFMVIYDIVWIRTQILDVAAATPLLDTSYGALQMPSVLGLQIRNTNKGMMLCMQYSIILFCCVE